MSAELSAGPAAEASGEARRPGFSLRTMLLMVGGVTLPIVVLDQVTKMYVRSHMQVYENITLIPHFLDITYALNPGVAFSMFADLPESFRMAVLPVLALAAISVMLFLLGSSPRPSLTSVALAMILAGATGNLIDRALRGGRVIDFVRAHYYSYNWPIFNVADSAISIGVAIILIGAVFGPHQSE